METECCSELVVSVKRVGEGHGPYITWTAEQGGNRSYFCVNKSFLSELSRPYATITSGFHSGCIQTGSLANLSLDNIGMDSQQLTMVLAEVSIQKCPKAFARFFPFV